MNRLLVLAITFIQFSPSVTALENDSITHHTIVETLQEKGKKAMTLMDKFYEVDSSYVQPRQYWAGIRLQDVVMQEELVIKSDDGTDIKLRSHTANYFGPKLQLGGVSASMSWNISAKKYNDANDITRHKTEFNLAMYSQMFTVDAWYRKTGGDFMFKRITLPGSDNESSNESFDAGGLTSIKTVGFNINYILSHKKFSMRAAYNANSRQLKSAGSPIMGFGYSHRKVQSMLNDVIAAEGMFLLVFGGTEDPKINQKAEKMLANRMPSTMTFDDYQLSLGYSYNWVPMRNLCLNATVAVQPAVKVAKTTNTTSDLISEAMKSYQDGTIYEEDGTIAPINKMILDAAYNKKKTLMDLNSNVRLSAIWNNDKWSVGTNFVYNVSPYHTKEVNMRHSFWAWNIAAGFKFFRKK